MVGKVVDPLTSDREEGSGLLVGAVAGGEKTEEAWLVQRVGSGTTLGTIAKGLKKGQPLDP